MIPKENNQNNPPLHVLVIDHSQSNATLILDELRKGGYTLVYKRVENAKELCAALNDKKWNIVISADDMQSFSLLSTLNILDQNEEDIPLIVISGGVHEDFAVEAMKRGAHDYLLKGNLKRLVPAVERELREVAIRYEGVEEEKRLQQYIYYDPISALPNRKLFCEHLQNGILESRRNRDPLAVFIIRINHFQQVSNALGLERSDSLLKQIGKRLQKSMDDPDAIAHFGGTTFATLLMEGEVEETIRTGKRLLAAMELPFMTENIPISLTGNVGVARFPEDGADTATLIQRAEIALHTAEQSGSGYDLYRPEMNSNSYQNLVLMGHMAVSIGKETEFFLQYQPQVEMKTMRIIGVEALVRWQHPERGKILPDQFITGTEQTGLIHPLTTWVLKTALQQYRAWQGVGIEIVQAVNVSARSLQDSGFPYHVANILKAQNGYPEWIQIEITEGAIMANPARAMSILTQLRNMDIALSMDDFGTGYSSLGRLKDIPVDEIKIDQSFVKNMLTNEDDAMMVRSMIDLIHGLGRIVLAEGVENQATWDMLASLGCDRAQGYFIARPMEGSAIPQWIKTSPYHTGE